MKIAIVTDAWTPQINGVVKTLEQTVRCLQAVGHEIPRKLRSAIAVRVVLTSTSDSYDS